MHVGIANPRLRGKRYRHSRRMRNPQFYVSGKRPMNLATIKLIFADDIPTMPGVSATPFWDWTGGSAQRTETTRSWAQKNLDNGKRKTLLMASFSYNLLGRYFDGKRRVFEQVLGLRVSILSCVTISLCIIKPILLSYQQNQILQMEKFDNRRLNTMKHSFYKLSVKADLTILTHKIKSTLTFKDLWTCRQKPHNISGYILVLHLSMASLGP